MQDSKLGLSYRRPATVVIDGSRIAAVPSRVPSVASASKLRRHARQPAAAHGALSSPDFDVPAASARVRDCSPMPVRDRVAALQERGHCRRRALLML